MLGLFALATAAFYAVFSAVAYPWNWSGVWKYRQQFGYGWLTTMGLSLVAMIVSITFGFLLMLGRRAPWLPVQMGCGSVVELVRGSPLLVQLLIGHYIIAQALNIDQPPPTNTDPTSALNN